MIQGKLVSLRPIEPEDLSLLCDMGNDVDVRGHVVGWNWLLPQHNQEAWLASALANTSTQRLIVCDPDGQAIGMTGLWDIDWHNRNALTALKLYEPRMRSKGLGTDAIKTIMAYAFYEVGLVRLWSQILPFNASSYAAYVRKSGWQVEGRARKHIFRNGKLHDLLHVAVLREDFEALPDAQDYRRLVFSLDASVDVGTTASAASDGVSQ